jgi:hypothetical protein
LKIMKMVFLDPNCQLFNSYAKRAASRPPLSGSWGLPQAEHNHRWDVSPLERSLIQEALPQPGFVVLFRTLSRERRIASLPGRSLSFHQSLFPHPPPATLYPAGATIN